MQKYKTLIISVGIALVLVVGFFSSPFIIERYKKAEIEKAHWEIEKARREAEWTEDRAREVAAQNKREERKTKVKEIVKSSYKLISLGNGDAFFVPLGLAGAPSKNLEAISIVMEYVQYEYYSNYTIFQIEYSDTETIGLWFKSNTVRVER